MTLRPAALLLLTACGPLSTKEVSLSTADDPGHPPLTAVRATYGTGDLQASVRAGSDELDVDAVLRWRGDEPEATLDVTDEGVAVLGNTCGDKARTCATDLDLVGPGLPLTVDLGTGDVVVDGGWAPLDVKVGTGDVDVRIGGGALKLDTGTGALTGAHVVATTADLRVGSGGLDLSFDAADEVAADVGTGDVTLRFAEAPSDVAVFAGTGDVVLSLPAGAYALDLTTGTGDVSVAGVTDDASAPVRVKVSVGTGDVTVRATE
jgi:hypothetical protein